MFANRRPVRTTAAAVILGLLCTAAAPCASARSVTPAVISESVPIVDANQLGQLTLEFRAPNLNDDNPGQTHVGVPVNIQRLIGIDLGIKEGWRQAAILEAEEVLAFPADRFTDHRSGNTGPDGRVSFAKLPLGLYTVTAPEGAELTFEPFVVTVPMTNATGTGWEYSFMVYPKAKVDAGTPTRDPEPDPIPGQEGAEPTTEPGGPGQTNRPGDSGPPESTPGDTEHSSGQPEKAGASGVDKSNREGLASTGAAVLSLVAAGLAMILLGLFLLRRRRTE